MPFALREQICRIITVHQLPFFALAGNKQAQSTEFLVHELSHELDLRLLSAVAHADMKGREEGCYGQRKAFADAHTHLCYFRGAGIGPGFAHHQPPGLRVVMMWGLPAPARSTGSRPILAACRWCRSMTRAAPGLRHGQNEGAAAHCAVDLATELLRARQIFVWNTTHLSAQLRKQTLDQLYAYDAQVELANLVVDARHWKLPSLARWPSALCRLNVSPSTNPLRIYRRGI